MTKQTAKELLEIVASDLLTIDLSDYKATYLLNNYANTINRAGALLLEELFTTKGDN